MPRPDLARLIPLPDIQSIFPPNEAYDYFKASQPLAVEGFHWAMASRLADATLLSYCDENYIKSECHPAGFTEVQIFENQGTQCFYAATDSLALVAFRGTTVLKPGGNLRVSDLRGSANAAFDALRDVVIDLSIIPSFTNDGGKIHAGFNQALDAVWDDLRKIPNPEIPVWFTGHSLGAALAVLAAQRYHQMNGKVGGVYTFGCPAVGDAAFAAHYSLKNQTFRFVNNNDWVPRLAIGYQHVGVLKYIQSNGIISDEDSMMDHVTGHARHAAEYIRNLGFLKPDMISSDSLSDHAPIFYATHLWNYYVNQL